MTQKKSRFAPSDLVVILLLALFVGTTGIYVRGQNRAQFNRDTEQEEVSEAVALPQSFSELLTVEEISGRAGEELKGSELTGITLEQQGSSPVYRVKLSDGRVLVYNAKNGMLVMSASNDDEVQGAIVIPPEFTSSIKIDDVRRIAQESLPRKPLKKVEFTVQDGRVIYSVGFSGDGRVDIDATTGEVLLITEGTDADIPGSDNDRAREDRGNPAPQSRREGVLPGTGTGEERSSGGLLNRIRS